MTDIKVLSIAELVMIYNCFVLVMILFTRYLTCGEKKSQKECKIYTLIVFAVLAIVILTIEILKIHLA